jgi:hypothetical protein
MQRIVIPDDVRAGAPAGFLAATATAGTMIAIGGRVATAARPFNIVAAHLLGASRADVWGFVAPVTIAGVVVHVLLTCFLGILVAAIVRRRFAPLWTTAAAAAVFCALVSIGIARRGGLSLASVFALGDLLVFYLTLWISLALGIRFALPPAERVRHADSM